MKFVLGKKDAVWWPVTVSMPDPENPGKTVQSTLKALIQPEGQDAFFEAQEAIAAEKTPRAQATAERAYLAGRIKDWDWPDVIGEDQRPVPFGPEAIGAALQEAWFRAGLWAALNEVSTGREARLGN